MKLHLGAVMIAVQSQISYSYLSGNLQHRRSSGTAIFGLSSSGKAEWAADDEGFSGFRDVSTQRKLNATFISNLDAVVGSLMTQCALRTVSYYMLEFRDEVTEKWMMSFNNYKTKGFPDGSWTKYIESMIETDKQRVEVLMKATRASLRARRIPEGANVMMQYTQVLEPRKVANQIITVREDVSNEMIQDLGCIQLENDEAVRFAKTWARDGLPSAEKSRKMTRMAGQSESTPARDESYVAFNMMMTAFAVQLVREDLSKVKQDIAVQMIDDLLLKMVSDDSSRTGLERMLHDTHGPRSFLEQLYYKGITEGVSGSGSKAVNTLKVIESIFAARLSIAKEASKLLSMQNMQNRQYYKMIKDHGGFQKLDMSNTPKMKFIDLDARDLADAKEEADEASEQQAIRDLAIAAAAATEALVADTGKEESLFNTDDDDDSGYSGSGGPMMM